jgi:hypothetical protein
MIVSFPDCRTRANAGLAAAAAAPSAIAPVNPRRETRGREEIG